MRFGSAPSAAPASRARVDRRVAAPALSPLPLAPADAAGGLGGRLAAPPVASAALAAANKLGTDEGAAVPGSARGDGGGEGGEKKKKIGAKKR